MTGSGKPSDEITLRIFNEYPKVTPKGRRIVDWEKALTEHPEWKAYVSYGSHDLKHKKGQNILARMNRQGLIVYGNRKQHPKATNGVHPEPAAAVAEETVTVREAKRMVREGIAEMLSQVCFCPRCGNNLTAIFQAASFNQTLHG
jgi:hypothetical protein